MYLNGRKILTVNKAPEINLQDKTITPTTSEQVIEADQGYKD